MYKITSSVEWYHIMVYRIIVKVNLHLTDEHKYVELKVINKILL